MQFRTFFNEKPIHPSFKCFLFFNGIESIFSINEMWGTKSSWIWKTQSLFLIMIILLKQFFIIVQFDILDDYNCFSYKIVISVNHSRYFLCSTQRTEILITWRHFWLLSWKQNYGEIASAHFISVLKYLNILNLCLKIWNQLNRKIQIKNWNIFFLLILHDLCKWIYSPKRKIQIKDTIRTDRALVFSTQ